MRSIALLVILTLVAGMIGGWLGVVYGERVVTPPGNLNTVVHRDLDLTVAQNKQIAALEKDFAARRKNFEADMRAANRDLASALNTDHSLNPKAQMAIDRFHRAEKGLEEATIRHVLAMRAVLNKQQSQKFDHAIFEALTAGSS